MESSKEISTTVFIKSLKKLSFLLYVTSSILLKYFSLTSYTEAISSIRPIFKASVPVQNKPVKTLFSSILLDLDFCISVMN